MGALAAANLGSAATDAASQAVPCLASLPNPFLGIAFVDFGQAREAGVLESYTSMDAIESNDAEALALYGELDALIPTPLPQFLHDQVVDSGLEAAPYGVRDVDCARVDVPNVVDHGSGPELVLVATLDDGDEQALRMAATAVVESWPLSELNSPSIPVDVADQTLSELGDVEFFARDGVVTVRVRGLDDLPFRRLPDSSIRISTEIVRVAADGAPGA